MLDSSGVWALERATRTLQVRPKDGVQAGRIARRWARAQRRSQSTWKPHTCTATGRVRLRRSRSRVRLMTNGNRGWVALNHGPAFASSLARYLYTSTINSGHLIIGIPDADREVSAPNRT